MISFKEFLTEKAVGGKPKYTAMSVKDAIDLLNKNCKDALWMLENNAPIWRGDSSIKLSEPFFTADPSLTTRKSENTSNFYTILLDNNPYATDFPKRSKSFVCSRSIEKADQYGLFARTNNGYVSTRTFAVIPFDGVKIGVVGKEDIWDTKITLWGKRKDIEYWNDVFDNAGFKEKNFLESLKKYQEKIKNDPEKFDRDFKTNLQPAELKKAAANFLADIEKAYSPASTKFTYATTATLSRKDKISEVWVGGPCMFIHLDMWEELRKAYAR